MKFFKKFSSILVALSAAMPASVFTATAVDLVTYDFPAATASDFVVSFCVIGASDASGSSSINTLSYTALPVGNFENGLKLYGNRAYPLAGVDDDTICKDGIYLRPNEMRVRETTSKIPKHLYDHEVHITMSNLVVF